MLVLELLFLIVIEGGGCRQYIFKLIVYLSLLFFSLVVLVVHFIHLEVWSFSALDMGDRSLAVVLSVVWDLASLENLWLF